MRPESLPYLGTYVGLQVISLRRIGLAGIIILIISLAISGAGYATGTFEWNPSDPGFIYSAALTAGFIASVAAGLFGAYRENEEFLIVGGVACIALALVNKMFINRLFSWGFLDAMWLVAGVLMILDRFHVQRVKVREAIEIQKTRSRQLLEKMDRLRTEVGTAEPSVAPGLRKEMRDVRRMLWTEAVDKPELARTLRGELFQAPVAREIVKRLVEADLNTVEPDIESCGIARYPKLSDIKGYSDSDVRVTLDDLVDAGILERELYEKAVACPQCHEPSKVFFRTKCSKCGSIKIHLNRLMEHRCGAMYKREEYAVPTGLQCPKCGKPIENEAELKPVGVAFECESCGSIFSDPTQSFCCRRCSVEFELKGAELANTHSYLLNEGRRLEAREVLAIAEAADSLEELGYEVQVSGSLKGKTGVDHQFTLVCKKHGKLLALDLVMARPEDKVDMPLILPSYAKFMDVPSITDRLLAAMPALEDRARDFLTANHVSSVEGQKLLEIGEGLRKNLG